MFRLIEIELTKQLSEAIVNVCRPMLVPAGGVNLTVVSPSTLVNSMAVRLA